MADSINFDDFVRLYINHRPVFGISKEQIQDAFATIQSTVFKRLGDEKEVAERMRPSCCGMTCPSS